MPSSFSAVEAALFFVLTRDGANDKQPPPPSPRPFVSPAESACAERAPAHGDSPALSRTPAPSCQRYQRQA